MLWIRIHWIRIRIQHFKWSGSRVLMTNNWKKYSWKKIYLFFDQIAIDWSLGLLKDVQAILEAFSPQKRTSSTSKHEIFELFSIFVGHPLTWQNPDPIRIRNTVLNTTYIQFPSYLNLLLFLILKGAQYLYLFLDSAGFGRGQNVRR
jgi:hypothetical protein